MERGLVNTQSGPGLAIPPLLPIIDSCGVLSLLFAGVTFEEGICGEAVLDEVEDRWRPLRRVDSSLVTSLFGVSCAADPGATTVRPSLSLDLSLLAASLPLLFRSKVAKSGLLAVPGDRYIERRFVCRSVSSCAS